MPALQRSISKASSGLSEQGADSYPLKFDPSRKLEYGAAADEDSASEYSDEESDVLSLYEKPLPPPPIQRETQAHTVPGRRGMGVTRRHRRSPSPLSIEWDPEEEEEEPAPRSLSRQKAIRRRITTSSLAASSCTSSVASEESLWFQSPMAEIPRSTNSSQPWRPLNIQKEPNSHISVSTSESSAQTGSVYSFSNGSTDTNLTATQPHIRIISHDPDIPPRQIYEGRLYETLSYIWETMSQPSNISTLDAILFRLAASPHSLVPHVKAGSVPLADFLRSTELVVHVLRGDTRLSQVWKSVDMTSLGALEITLPSELVDMLNTSHEPVVTSIKALLRIHVISEIGEFLASHILYRGNTGVMITKSLDLTYQSGKGGETVIRGMLGGVIRYRRFHGRMEVLLLRDSEVRRVPKWLLEEFYHLPKISKCPVDDLDL